MRANDGRLPYLTTRDNSLSKSATSPATKSNETKMKKKLINHYNVTYKTNQAPPQTFFVDKHALKGGKLFVRRFKTKQQATLRTRKRTRSLLNSDSEGDFTRQHRNNKWCVCLLKKLQSEKQQAVCDQHAYLTIDRDFNGARNIYLKHMGGRPNTLNESK